MTTPIPASEFEEDDPRVVIIGGKEPMYYYWSIGIKFQYQSEIVLHFMPYNSPTVVRVLDLYRQFGITEKHGSRKEVMVKGKGNEMLRIREIIIKKPGMLLP